MPISQDTVQGFDYGLPPYLEAGVINLLNAKLPAGLTNAAVITLNTLSAAANNTVALQAALARGGYVAFLDPGIVWINATLTVYSNTQIYVGPGVTIKMATGSVGGIFRNYAGTLAIAAGVNVPIGNAAYALAPDGVNTAIVCTGLAAGTGALFPVGSYVSAVVAGHAAEGAVGNAQLNRGYRGVWKVVANTDTSVTYEVRPIFPGLNNNNVAMTLYPADVNIKYCGPGTIDGNLAGINPNTYADGHPLGWLIATRHAKDVTIDGLNFAPGSSWVIGSNYARNYVVRNCTGDVRGFRSLDPVHLVGQHQQVTIDNLKFLCSDNVVGLTIDTPNEAIGVTPNYLLQNPGDMYDVTVTRIWGNCYDTGSVTAIVGIYGPAAYAYHNLTFDDISGYGSSAFNMASYNPTKQLNCNGDKIRVTNLHALTGGSQFIINNTAVVNWNEVVLDDFIITTDVAAFQIGTGTSGTINQLHITNMYYIAADNSATGTAFPMIQLEGVNINNLTVSAIENVNLATTVPLIRHAGTSTIGKASVTNCSANSVGGAGSALYSVIGAGVCNSLTFNNCSFTGTGAVGALLSLGATAAYLRVILNTCIVYAAQAAIVTANTAATIAVFIDNLTLAGTACANAAQFAGPTNLFVNGYHELTAPTNFPFKMVTGGATAYNFNFENISRTGDLVQFIAAATGLRMRGSAARTALTNVGAAQPGDMVWDINVVAADSGMFGRTQAGAWSAVRIF